MVGAASLIDARGLEEAGEESDGLGVLHFAALGREALAREFRGDEVGELFAWLLIARAREALVTEAYASARIERHLAAVARATEPRDGVIDVLRQALRLMESQETSHGRILERILSITIVPGALLERLRAMVSPVQGRVEGVTIAGLVDPCHVRRGAARATIAMVSLVEEMPSFGDPSAPADFAAYCRLSAALEQTAVAGYGRIRALISMVAARGQRPSWTARTPSPMPSTVPPGAMESPAPPPREGALSPLNERMLSDERYHAALFAHLARAPLKTLTAEQLSADIESLQTGIYGAPCDTPALPAHSLADLEPLLRSDPVIAALQARTGASAWQGSLRAAAHLAQSLFRQALSGFLDHSPSRLQTNG